MEKQASIVYNTPDALVGISKSQAQMFLKAGYKNIGAVALLMEDPIWFDQVAGIGYTVAQHITIVMQREGFVDRNSETWKVAFHRDLYREIQEKRNSNG